MSTSLPGSAVPTIKRRLMSMVYEVFLIVAVLLLAETLVTLATLNGKTALLQAIQKLFVFMVMAAYFIHFWVDSGHTLAMKTWRIRLIMPGHAKVPLRKAAIRFMLAWGWFLPALVACYVTGWKTPKQVSIALLAGVAGWALTALFDKDRQFLHDRLAGTRLVQLPKPLKQGQLLPAAPA